MRDVPQDIGDANGDELTSLGHDVLSLRDGWWAYESRQQCNVCGERYAEIGRGAGDGSWGGYLEVPVSGFRHREGCPVPAIEEFRERHLVG